LPVGLIAVLAGCEPMPSAGGQSGDCSNQQACEAAAFMVASMQPLVGMDAGMGVTVGTIQAVGPTIVMDMRMPETAAELGVGLDPRFDALMQEFMADSVALAACTPDPAGMTAEPFLDLGGRFRMRMISSDGMVVADSTITSCTGIT
jgi:hypothetical protein